ncbi:hypothetical protein B566_EDAN002143 [Ephemera danica]|nr:hypothetical protein B566_EDAN002143 [Ephemera danica]
MVASGLPVKNGKQHVSEIATMALDLLAGSTAFAVPHRPGQLLQIRSGVHTGPVVAGIVGSKMPPLRIHISLEMKQALDCVGGFITERRGLVEVKGKGLMETYWLLEKEGGISRATELDMPGFFEDVQPVFMRRLHLCVKTDNPDANI